MSWRLSDLASLVGGTVRGDPNRRIREVETLENAGPDDLSFFTNPRYKEAALTSHAGAFLVGAGKVAGNELSGRDLIEAAEPYVALAQILEKMHPEPHPAPGISPDARIHPSASLGKDVAIAAFAVIGKGSAIGDRTVIGAGAVIGEECVIEEDTTIQPRVVLYPRTRVGTRCILHAGCVLGADGFGFATSQGVHRKVPQLGCVVVEDDVEIGANTTIDRGTLGETRIGRGSKLDNLVMVAHGVVLGRGTMMAAQSGIAGSTRVGDYVTVAGQSGAAGHLTIGARAVVAAKSAVFQDVPEGAVVAGIPAVDEMQWKRMQATAKTLPELKTKLNQIEERLGRGAGKGKGER